MEQLLVMLYSILFMVIAVSIPFRYTIIQHCKDKLCYSEYVVVKEQENNNVRYKIKLKFLCFWFYLTYTERNDTLDEHDRIFIEYFNSFDDANKAGCEKVNFHHKFEKQIFHFKK